MRLGELTRLVFVVYVLPKQLQLCIFLWKLLWNFDLAQDVCLQVNQVREPTVNVSPNNFDSGHLKK